MQSLWFKDSDKMTPQDRITELTTRQMYVGSSMIVKLNAVKGKFFYKVWAYLDQGTYDTKFPVIEGKYEGQDPDDLFQLALTELGIKKLKLGVPKT